MFSKEERSTFPYWFAHWCAFNMTALNLRWWKPKYLFHDIEKPFLMLLWKDYTKVQKWHRTHNNHHLEYKNGVDNIDWVFSGSSRLGSSRHSMASIIWVSNCSNRVVESALRMGTTWKRTSEPSPASRIYKGV